MSKIALEGNASGTGTFTVAAPNSNSNFTLTLPVATGTVVVTGGAQTIEFAAGTASLPSITFTGDTNTGIFSPAADTIAFSEGGVEAMRLDSSGNLGVGTTSPANRLSIGAGSFASATSQTTGMYTNGTSGLVMLSDAYSFNSRTGSGFMNIDSSGNVGIGTTSPADAQLTTAVAVNAASGYCGFRVLSNGTAVGRVVGSVGEFRVDSLSTNPLTLYTNGSERARITSDGDLLVGTTNSSGTVGAGFKVLSGRPVLVNAASTDGAGTVYEAYSTGAAAYRFYVGMGGTIFATNTTISAISDQRHKENIRDLDVGLNAVMQLKPRKFDWKEGKGQNTKDCRGFIAQEFERVFPDLIDEWQDPAPEGEEPYKSVRQDLIPVLVKAIQELKAELDTVKAELATLKGQ